MIRRSRGGFSLLELLAVMAILGVAATLLAPALRSTLAPQRLTVAADELVATLSQARQTAMGSGLPVELRIYEVPTETEDPAFRAWRLVRITNQTGPDGKLIEEPVGRVGKFSTGVVAVATAGAPFSTVLTDPLQTAGDLSETVPGFTGSKPYRTVRFLPNGQMDLPITGADGGEAWTLTLANTRDAEKFSGTDMAANYVVLTLDPLTGAVQSFRP